MSVDKLTDCKTCFEVEPHYDFYILVPWQLFISMLLLIEDG